VVQEVASTAHRDVAVEVLWPGQAFVGVRWAVDQSAAAAAAASRAIAIVSDQNLHASAHDLEGASLALLGAIPSPDLEFIELGALNAWTSVGSEVLWRRGETSRPAALEALLAGRPDLITCAYPVAVELTVTNPRPCWIGIIVSINSVSSHYLDRPVLDQILVISV